MIGDDPDDVYDFCMIITTVEAFVLKGLADQRKREMERMKAKNK